MQMMNTYLKIFSFPFIIFLLLNKLYADANYDQDSHCCAQYGHVRDGSSGQFVKVTVWEGLRYSAKNTVNPVIGSIKSSYDSDRTCGGVGIVHLNDAMDSYVPGSDWYTVTDESGTYDNREWYIYTRDGHYSCLCETPDVNNSDQIDASQWEFVSDWNSCIEPMPEDWGNSGENSGCLEPDGIEYLNVQDIISCCSIMSCYKKAEPQYNCSDLGEDWEYNSASTEPACSAWVDGINYVSSQFVTGDGHSDTCCLQQAPDAPDDNDTPDGGGDGNDTNPSDPNPTDDPNDPYDQCGLDSNPCSGGYIFNPDSCMCTIGTGDNGTGDSAGDSSGDSPIDQDGNGIDDRVQELEEINDNLSPTGSTGQRLSQISTSTASMSTDTEDIKEGITGEGGTNEKLDLTNEILAGIQSDIQSGNTQNHTDLTQIQDILDTSSAQNHEDLTGIKDSVDGLGEGIDNIGEDVAENLKEEVDTSSIDGLSELPSTFENAKNTIVDSFNAMITNHVGIQPTFTASGDCSYDFTVFGTTISFNFGMAEILRPYFDVVFALFLAWVNFRIYLYIFHSFVEKS